MDARQSGADGTGRLPESRKSAVSSTGSVAKLREGEGVVICARVPAQIRRSRAGAWCVRPRRERQITGRSPSGPSGRILSVVSRLDEVHHRGRTSGRDYVNPNDVHRARHRAGRHLRRRNQGRSIHQPRRYHNLIAAGDGSVERGTETDKVTVSELSGAERDRIYAEQEERYQGFAEYARQPLESAPFRCSNLRGHSPRP